jgi:hypothetical protein
VPIKRRSVAPVPGVIESQTPPAQIYRAAVPPRTPLTKTPHTSPVAEYPQTPSIRTLIPLVLSLPIGAARKADEFDEVQQEVPFEMDRGFEAERGGDFEVEGEGGGESGDLLAG